MSKALPESFLQKHISGFRDKKYLLAISGGVDSMVLLHMFRESGLKYSVAHCNFQLRGEASNADEELVKQTCKDYGISCFVKHFEIQDTQTEKPTSTQMLAREMRYAWFHELMQEHKLHYLVVAHHATDQVETVLLNLVRGTGISGLRGMKPVHDYIIRPLLHCSKEDILFYAEKNNVKWREDASNQKNDYKRNLLRNKVLPLLKELNPSLEATFAQNLEKLSDAEQVFLSEVKKEILISDENGTPIIPDSWIQSQKANPTLLFEKIKHYGFTYDQAKLVFEEHIRGKSFPAEEKEMIRVEHGWAITDKSNKSIDSISIGSIADTKTIELPYARLNLKVLPVKDFMLKKNPAVLSLDLDKIQFPLQIRGWQEGDKFVPFGMKGMKKISDFLIDKKVPLYMKNRVLVMEDASNKLLGLLNYRGDDRFKIDARTNNILEVTFTAI